MVQRISFINFDDLDSEYKFSFYQQLAKCIYHIFRRETGWNVRPKRKIVNIFVSWSSFEDQHFKLF